MVSVISWLILDVIFFPQVINSFKLDPAIEELCNNGICDDISDVGNSLFGGTYEHVKIRFFLDEQNKNITCGKCLLSNSRKPRTPVKYFRNVDRVLQSQLIEDQDTQAVITTTACALVFRLAVLLQHNNTPGINKIMVFHLFIYLLVFQ